MECVILFKKLRPFFEKNTFVLAKVVFFPCGTFFISCESCFSMYFICFFDNIILFHGEFTLLSRITCLELTFNRFFSLGSYFVKATNLKKLFKCYIYIFSFILFIGKTIEKKLNHVPLG